MAGEGRSAATLGEFYDLLGPDKYAALQAASLDFGTSFKNATDTHAPLPVNVLIRST